LSFLRDNNMIVTFGASAVSIIGYPKSQSLANLVDATHSTSDKKNKD